MQSHTSFHRVYPKLILISQAELLDVKGHMATFEAALAGGVDTILLREPSMSSSALLSVAATLRELTHQYQAKLLIHTHADIAQAVGADGVHVRSADMHEIPAMQAWVQGDEMMFSASCHTLEELKKAERFGANFVFLSPVFATQSHPEAKALGVAAFQSLAEQSALPVVALGGISIENRALLKGYAVAVMRGLLFAKDVSKAAHLLQEGWG